MRCLNCCNTCDGCTCMGIIYIRKMCAVTKWLLCDIWTWLHDMTKWQLPLYLGHYTEMVNASLSWFYMDVFYPYPDLTFWYWLNGLTITNSIRLRGFGRGWFCFKLIKCPTVPPSLKYMCLSSPTLYQYRSFPINPRFWKLHWGKGERL